MSVNPSSAWLALLHQLPAKPPYLRVKVWRRLHAMGAVPLKNAVHVLPLTEANEALFRHLLDEIVAGGGEATLVRASLLAGQDDEDVRALFDAARDADYHEIALAARRLIETGPASAHDIARLQKRLQDVGLIDFFASHGRQEAQAALAELDRQRYQHPDVSRAEPAPPVQPQDLIGKVWVTRRGVHVDRIACAWLIRRFIDPGATFRFVDGKSHQPSAGELRFDMSDAEFTHEGDRCSFETILLKSGLADDAGLKAIGEIIHELDIADGKYLRAETPGLGAMLSGVCAATDDDLDRIARAGDALDQFYAFFSDRKSQR